MRCLWRVAGRDRMITHEHVFGVWDANRPAFCAVCDMPEQGWEIDWNAPPCPVCGGYLDRPHEHESAAQQREGAGS